MRKLSVDITLADGTAVDTIDDVEEVHFVSSDSEMSHTNPGSGPTTLYIVQRHVATVLVEPYDVRPANAASD